MGVPGHAGRRPSESDTYPVEMGVPWSHASGTGSMDIGILGTGTVGRSLGGALSALGHDVVMGTRDVAGLEQRTDEFKPWHDENPAVRLGTFNDAAGHGALVINATNGSASLDAVAQAGAQNLSGKILVDAANPLDFSHGMPPTLTIANTDSLGEQLQQALPETAVVKALNTVNAAVMVAPHLVADGTSDLFICGNDDAAKEAVATLLSESFGWQSIVDLGDITGARAMEMYLPLWVRLMTAQQTPMFNIKVVR